MNLPTLLTFVRLIFVPLIVILFYLPLTYSGLIAAIIFALAAITDAFDGYLARKYNQTTRFGAFLDPVADKIIVAVSLALIIEDNATIFITIPSLIIISREIVVSSLREWIASIKKDGHSIPVSILAKFKTAFQLVSIATLLAFGKYSFINFSTLGTVMHNLGIILLYVATALTLWSMTNYLKVVFKR